MSHKVDANIPKFTIITSTFNAGKYIEESINSVISQDYKHYQYIIVDSESTDGTRFIIEKYRRYIDVFISEKDSGIYEAWNKALRYATGDWILFIGADDVLVNDALSSYCSFITKRQMFDVLFISSKCNLISDSGKYLRNWGKEYIWNEFSWNLRISHVGALHSKRLFEEYGKFDESYKIAGDYELLLRPGKNLSTSFMNKVTTKMRVSGVSNSNLNSYKEAIRAKSTTGGRLIFYCYLDALYIFAVANIRRIFR